MRVLITTDAVGGVWTFTQQLAQTLLAQKHSVALVNVGPSPSESQRDWCNHQTLAHGSHFYFEDASGALEWMDDNIGAYLDAEQVLLRLTDEFLPDVFLSGQFCFGKLPIGVPKVVVAHSDVLSWAQCCRGGPLPSSEWLGRYVQLVSEGIEAADALVAPTLWMHSALSANFTLPQHTVVISNGRDIPALDAKPIREHQAVSAGRFWDEAKNLQILDQLPPGIPVKVAGSVADSGAARTTGRVSLCGKLPERTLLELFHSSSIYVCTSIYEPFGLAPLEAALCGCAVVANDIPSLHEIWGDAAIFFRGAGQLAAILEDLRDPAALSGAQTRAFARARLFTAERMTERYLNLFERLIRANHGARRSSTYAA